MASIIRHVSVVFFLVSLLHFGSSSSEKELEYEKWISWNKQNYLMKKKIMATETVRGIKVVDVKLRNAEMNKVRVSVSQNGTGDFMTIREALASIHLKNTKRVVLDIGPGVYREKIIVPKTMDFITFLGNASDPPTITWNDTASSINGRDGRPMKTFQSATVAVDASYFLAFNIKFENTAPHKIGSAGEQAVALRISGTKAAFYSCSFYGSQDTLYDHKGLHYFYNCFIQGSVDFIFGYGRSLYENCHLNSLAKKVASLTAQKRNDASMQSGFSFKDSKITGSGHVYLGRAWGDYSRVVFSYTFMDSLVLPQGWSDWGKQSNDERVYYGEYECSGPGANLSGRVSWARILTAQEAKPFIGTYFIDGDTWLTSPLTAANS
ncbi:Pectinesterase [Heracleum sosnowskyi]|uniref:Pectinesterase n=1 Tax=Heracleum sosnowskyi TaxID=360622 RepID=A0AAD8GZ85_9APIA|nr:Pectinesterase [Heracleum sosnowskyi]